MALARGKSTIINLLDPDRDSTRAVAYRLDKFTPNAFVTHATNVRRDKLREIDLLRKLKDKVLLVKELAPIFRGREDKLRDNFATLTAVLDGKGLVTASGVHGTKEDGGPCVFNWLGATTPIPARAVCRLPAQGSECERLQPLELGDPQILPIAPVYYAPGLLTSSSGH